jgi:DNA modification methylase
MQIEKIKIDKLKAATYNPRKDLKPGDAEFEKLRRSIEEFGYVEPAIWNKRTGNIVGGHQRIKVLKHLGHTEADCVVIDIDETQEKALNIALNKISGTWDEGLLTALLKDLEHMGYDLTLTGFDASETSELFGKGAIENAHEDDFDANKALEEAERHTITKTGDIWKLGRHKLLCGDSTKSEDVEKLFGNEKADLIVTDPPYNVDYGASLESRNILVSREDSHIANDNMSDVDFKNFLSNYYAAAYSVLKAGAPIYVFHSTKETVNFIQAMKEAGFKYAQTLVWYKNHFTLGRQDYQWIHEPILYGWKEGAGHYFVNDRTKSTVYQEAKKDFNKLNKKEAIELLEKVFAEERQSVIHCDKPSKSELHPTIKPIKLCAELICNSSKVGELVYDGFCGSGSTMIAADQVDRRCYLIELEPKYCDATVKRYINQTGSDKNVTVIRDGKETKYSEMLKGDK